MEFEIKGRMIGLNEYTNACRTNPYKANKLKHEQQAMVEQAFLSDLRHFNEKVTKYPCSVKITWYEPNKRRDVDNIQFAIKFILDALVNVGFLEDDSQKYVTSVSHEVKVDKENPRIEVVVE